MTTQPATIPSPTIAELAAEARRNARIACAKTHAAAIALEFIAPKPEHARAAYGAESYAIEQLQTLAVTLHRAAANHADRATQDAPTNPANAKAHADHAARLSDCIQALAAAAKVL
jgi:hypothetical protein